MEVGCLDKAIKTRNTSTRLESNTAEGVERAVLEGLPNWRSYPRVLRIVFGQLYRFGGLEECLATLGKELELFDADYSLYVDKKSESDLIDFAGKWYKYGTLPKTSGRALSFTQINQQLFYEATMGSNAVVSYGGAGAQDVKMASEGGFGNHLAVERLRHNTMRKANAELAARDAIDAELSDREDVEDIFGGRELEYNPIDDGETN